MSDGRRVLVTGAADGLGRRVAERFAVLGDRVVLADVNAARLAATATEMRAARYDVDALEVDVKDAAGVREAVDSVVTRWGGIDVAISNAGVAASCDLLGMEIEEWRRVIDVNLTGTFNVITSAARVMASQRDGGAICCISSGAGFVARPGAAHYCTSKAGVHMLAKSLAMEAGRAGVRVNVVAPGLVDHGYRDGLGQFVPQSYADMMRVNTPLQRLGTADEVASMVLYLCSDNAAFVTGAVVPVDGGSTAGRYTMPWSAS